MITLSSCLICQIISFILPRNEYGCVCAWTTLGHYFENQGNVLAHFDLGGYVNKQNCRIWGTEDPHAYIEKPTHPKRVTVWCGFWSRGIIGPFFFENKQTEVVTVNGNRYRAMLNEFLFTKIEDENIGFNRTVLHSVFCFLLLRINSRRANIFWPPRSWNLTPLDYYLWGAVKGKFYTDKPKTIEALKDNIREAIGEIQLHTIDNVLKNCTDRVG